MTREVFDWSRQLEAEKPWRVALLPTNRLYRSKDERVRKNSAGVAIRSPVRVATLKLTAMSEIRKRVYQGVQILVGGKFVPALSTPSQKSAEKRWSEIACRPPATEIAFRSLRAARTTLCTSSRDRGCEIPSPMNSSLEIIFPPSIRWKWTPTELL